MIDVFLKPVYCHVGFMRKVVMTNNILVVMERTRVMDR